MKPGRKPTAKTVKEYFESGTARKMWKEGIANKDSAGAGSAEFDDGKYRVKIEKAYTAMSKSSSRPQNVIEFKFMDGEYKGQKVYSYQGLDNPTGIAIAINVLEKLGQAVESPEEIEAADRKLSKTQPEVELRLQTRGEFQNKVIVAKLDDSDDSEEDDEDVDVEEADEDDEETVAPIKKGKKAVADDEDSDDEDASEDSEKDDSDGDEDKDETDESDEEDEDEDDEDEKPVKKNKAKPVEKKKSKSEDAEDAEEDDEDAEDEADDEDSEDDEEEVTLEPGMKLKVKHDGETVKVKIIKVDEKAKEVRVKLADGSKITISVDDIVDVIS